MRNYDWFLIPLLLLIVILIVVGGEILTDNVDVRGRCLRLGYPSHMHDGNTPYCIRRVDGTDKTVPLWTLKEELEAR